MHTRIWCAFWAFIAKVIEKKGIRHAHGPRHKLYSFACRQSFRLLK